MTINISLLMPTRERPYLVKRFFKELIATTSDLSAVEVVLYIDEDDRRSQAIDNTLINLTKIIGPSSTMGAYLSACQNKSQGEIIILVNDDMVIRTMGWDRLLLEYYNTVKDRIFLAYGDDLFQGKKVCTFPIISQKTCAILEDPFPLIYQGAFIDTHLFDIFKRLEKLGYNRIRFFDNLIFEHLHYRTGKAPLDNTYKLRNRFGDDDTFTLLHQMRQQQALRLRDAIVKRERTESPGSFQREECDQLPTSSLPFTQSYAKAVKAYAKHFLMDGKLPLWWRLRLFVWFCGRNLARRGHLNWYETFRDTRRKIRRARIKFNRN